MQVNGKWGKHKAGEDGDDMLERDDVRLLHWWGLRVYADEHGSNIYKNMVMSLRCYISTHTHTYIMCWNSEKKDTNRWSQFRNVWGHSKAKLTIVGGVDAFEQAALSLQAGDVVPLAVKHLQPGEDRGIQLRQPVIPHVQLGHVPQ